MNTPEQYLLDEWDTLCARANKSLHSDCPLLEDEVLVAMHKYVSEQEARISALEEFVGIISKGIPNVPNLTETYVKLAIDLLREKPEKTEQIKMLREALEMFRPEIYYNQNGEEVDAGGNFTIYSDGVADNEAMQKVHEALEATKD